MNNPLMQMLQRQQPQQMAANNPMQMLQKFAEFRKSITPEGAKNKIDELRKSGQMDDNTYDQLVQQAKALQSIFK